MPAILTTAVAFQTPGGSTVLAVPSSGYEAAVMPSGRPGRRKRRQVAQGAYNPGEVQLSEVIDTSQLVLVVRVVGSSQSDLDSKYDDLVAAVEQGPGGLVAVTFGGSTRTWHATGSPDVESKGDRDGDVLRWGHREEVTITWPMNPYPT